VARRRLLRDRETGHAEEVGAGYIPLDIGAGTYLEQPTVVPKAFFLCVEELSGQTDAHARDQRIARMPTADEADTFDLAPGAAVVHLITAESA
jgi:GntR family transcriptional regulator